MPIRWRLTVFNSLVIAVILLVLGSSVFLLVRKTLFSGTEATVQSAAHEVARTFSDGQDLSPDDVERLTLEGVFVVVRDGEGRILMQTVDRLPPEAAAAGHWRRALENGEPAGGRVDPSATAQDSYVYAAPLAFTAAEGDDGNYSTPAETVTVPPPHLTGARVVEVGKSYESATATLRALGIALAAGTVAVLLLSVAGAYLLARAALSPVGAVVGAARGITEGDLSKRLPVKHPKDEIGRLATTINDLLARLEAAFARREEALARQRRFVADAGHELRTPLTSIGGYARMLEEWGLRNPQTAREAVAAISRESERMRNLAEGLLALARGDEGAPMDARRQDLAAVAADVVEAARAASGGKPTIEYVAPANPACAAFDRDRIRQAAAILVDNAVKYTPEEGEVKVSVGERDGWIELEVSDTGIGISEAQILHIFERFYRAEGARAPGGAGLGLAIARQVAEAHGGEIAVESELGRGSTFVLRIPRSDE